MTDIIKIKFDKESVNGLPKNVYYNDWPVVYMLEGKKEAYIGETTNFRQRIYSHIDDVRRKEIEDVYRIENEKFNKSAALDIEALLIEYIAADGKYKLQNNNHGIKNHNYYDRGLYREEFSNVWKKLIDIGVAKHSLLDIQNSELFKISPFKSLTDEQYDVVNMIDSVMKNTQNSRHIIHGEPGTGKTILAVYMMKYFVDQDSFADKKLALVIPMTSLRKSVKNVFKTVKGLKPSQVIGPYDAVKGEKYDLLIVDEAHRLTKRKNLSNYSAYDNVNKKLGTDTMTTTQLDWLRLSSKHLVMFYDKNQTVKPSDVNSDIFKMNYSSQYTLTTQFRVKANFDYTRYVEQILTQSNNFKHNFVEYDLKLFRNIEAMITSIKNKDNKYGLSRVVAGYAWDWVSKKDKSKFDIKINGQSLKWNSTNIDWINSDNAINEVGCIHTTQGYDLNYCGVIIGMDLVYRNGKIQYNPDGYKDSNAKDLTLTDNQMLDYIVNIYKVLMTRGIYGTYIYVCDDALRDYFAKFIEYDKGHLEDYTLVAESEGE